MKHKVYNIIGIIIAVTVVGTFWWTCTGAVLLR